MIRDHLQENENVKPNTAFLEELKNKLPEFFNDEGFDIEKFQNALKENDVNEFSEGYQLNFIGKDYARKQAGDAPTSVIVPDNEHNQKEENRNSKNLFFTGDNLEVLRHLRNNYSNKIDVIYIDPPYNTGNDDFVYPDKFEYSNKQLKEVFGMSDDDVSKLDALKGSKSHSAWLTFMYPRLQLAKSLLTSRGVIFISIDDNEDSNLKEICDEIFGENNFLAQVIWERAYSPINLKKNFSPNHDYMLVYGINANVIETNGIQRDKKSDNRYQNPDDDPRGPWKPGDISVGPAIESNIYTIITPSGRVVNPPSGRSWRISEKIFKEKIRDNRIWFGKEGTNIPQIKRFRSELRKKGITPMTIWKYKDVGHSQSATQYLQKLMGDKKYFDYPKPVELIKQAIQLYSTGNSIILDFFAGSATTAEAVMQLNAEDGGNRKFIMVQLPEKTYELDKNDNKKPTKGGKAAFDDGYMSIDGISRERIKRAAKKIKDENPDLSEDFDGGFKHYRVVSPEKETLDKIYDFDPENYELVSDMVESFSSSALGVPGKASGEDTILTTWLAEDGYDFNTDDLVEYDFAGYKAFGIKDTRLYLIDGNLHPEQTKELLNQLGTNKVKFQSIVVYGYSFNVLDMKELERGLSQLNSNVNLIKRY